MLQAGWVLVVRTWLEPERIFPCPWPPGFDLVRKPHIAQVVVEVRHGMTILGGRSDKKALPFSRDTIPGTKGGRRPAKDTLLKLSPCMDARL